MQISDRERWDERYRRVAAERLDPPDPWVARWVEALGPPPPAGRALDLAGGRGRHALLLARRGWRTCLWDVSPVGLAQARAAAGAAGLALETRATDLAGAAPPPAQPFELVVIVNFLHRPLFRDLAHLVVPGGHALVVTFTTERAGTRPPLRHCLLPGELARGLPGFETLEARERDGRAGLLARRQPAAEGSG